jgi:hypothetical protein
MNVGGIYVEGIESSMQEAADGSLGRDSSYFFTFYAQGYRYRLERRGTETGGEQGVAGIEAVHVFDGSSYARHRRMTRPGEPSLVPVSSRRDYTLEPGCMLANNDPRGRMWFPYVQADESKGRLDSFVWEAEGDEGDSARADFVRVLGDPASGRTVKEIVSLDAAGRMVERSMVRGVTGARLMNWRYEYGADADLLPSAVHFVHGMTDNRPTYYHTTFNAWVMNPVPQEVQGAVLPFPGDGHAFDSEPQWLDEQKVVVVDRENSGLRHRIGFAD